MTITNSLVYANGLTGLCTALYCLPYIYSLKAFVLLQGFLRCRVSIKEPIDSLVSIHVSFHVFGSNITCCLYAHYSFWKRCKYRVLLKYCVFFLQILWFFWTLPVMLQCWWCLTCHCVHTLTPRGNRERPESGIYFKIFKKTQYFMNTL